MEALLDGLSECETLQCDGTVGYGGSPDEHGETRLDALVFDGPSHNMGAVASMRRIRDAARVAQAVMKFTKHSMLVGEAATKFAIEMGFKEETLTTNSSRRLFHQWLDNKCQPNFRKNVSPDPRLGCGPYRPLVREESVEDERICPKFERWSHDTVGMLVMDSQGNMAAGTSTNGATHKVSGRVGDSPIPGAGAYVSNEFGAAAATGDGDIMMRFLPSYQAVEGMRRGESVQKAVEVAVWRIAEYFPDFSGAVIAVNKAGEHAAACHGLQSFEYSVRDPGFQKVHVFDIECL